MPSYFVTWEIDIDAGSPREAAKQALAHITSEGSLAHVFDVIECDTDGEKIRVDLDELETVTCTRCPWKAGETEAADCEECPECHAPILYNGEPCI